MKKIDLFQVTQPVLKQKLKSALEKVGYNPVCKKGFLYAEGTVPVLLVAHLDTVHKELPRNIWFSPDGDKWKADEGIGGDDRCGVYAILKLIRQHHVHVLFCEDEEIGGVGASKFVKSGIKPDVKFIIEFDRKGSEDAVFYDCDNPEFTKFICSFGFKEAYGTFSDISTLAPALGVAAVNLSSGYYNAHTSNEYIVWSKLEANIKKVDKLLRGELKKFEYIEAEYAGYGYGYGYGKNSNYGYGWNDDYERYGDYNGYSNYGNIKLLPGREQNEWRHLMRFDGIVRDTLGNEIEVEATDYLVMIDRDGNVYELWDDDTYVLMPGAYAIDSATGMAVKFDFKKSNRCWTEA